MKNYIKSLFIIVALLYSMNTLAEPTIKVNGIEVGTTATGLDNDGNKASASIAGGKCTLTMTPGSGKYITANDISAIKTIDGGNAQTRTPGINTPVTITATDETADPSGATSYTFDVTDENYDYEVTANFQTRISIESDYTIALSPTEYTYSGEANKPTVTLTVGGTALTSGTDYNAYYADSINAGTGKVTLIGIRKYTGSLTGEGESGLADLKYTISAKSIANVTVTLSAESFTFNGENQKPTVTVKDGETNLVLDNDYTLTNEGGTDVGKYTVTVTGKGNYTGEISKEYSITANTMEVTAEGYTGTYDGKAYGITVTAPEGATIKYGTAEGTYDLTASPTYTNAGTYTVYYSVSKTNYADVTGSKNVVINKATATLSYSATTAEGKMGEAFTAPTLNNPSQVAVTYSSSNTEVATIGTDGVVTLTGAGKTTITAAFAGNDNYEATSASYELTVAEQQNKLQEAGLSWTDESMDYYLGDYWWGPRLNNPNNLTVEYSSKDEKVATIDENGVVTALSPGTTFIIATFKGSDQYEAQSVQYVLNVFERYDLWVNGIQVESENYKDILGDGHFFFDKDNKQLVVTSNSTPVAIESRMKSLTIFLNGSSKLERIFFNNEGNEQNTGSLTITTYENIPGTTTLETTNANGVISGFSNLTIDKDKYTFLLDPENGLYVNGTLREEGGSVAKTATIGQYIKPLVNGQTVNFPIEKFENTKLTNTVVDDVHYALVQHDEDTDEDDDYYDPAINAVVLNNLGRAPYDPLYNPLAEDLLEDLIPGSRKYASEVKSLMTFMVPNGKGKISLDVETDRDHHLNLTIGNGEPKRISKNKREKVEFDYDVDKPTYCFLFLGGGNGASGTRIGKRDKHHGTIYSIKVEPLKTLTQNPLGEVSGFPNPKKPEVTLFGGATGIKEIKVEPAYEASGDDSWYDLQGRKIDKPTKAGIYIRNRKKIVIK